MRPYESIQEELKDLISSPQLPAFYIRFTAVSRIQLSEHSYSFVLLKGEPQI